MIIFKEPIFPPFYFLSWVFFFLSVSRRLHRHQISAHSGKAAIPCKQFIHGLTGCSANSYRKKNAADLFASSKHQNGAFWIGEAACSRLALPELYVIPRSRRFAAQMKINAARDNCGDTSPKIKTHCQNDQKHKWRIRRRRFSHFRITHQVARVTAFDRISLTPTSRDVQQILTVKFSAFLPSFMQQVT